MLTARFPSPHSQVRTTIKYVRVLLASDRIKIHSGERTLLKNLGQWLGRLTLAKNRPILQRDLDVKETLLKAFAAGKMIAVIPFVRMLIEPCLDSKIFKPPNPWLMGEIQG